MRGLRRILAGVALSALMLLGGTAPATALGSENAMTDTEVNSADTRAVLNDFLTATGVDGQTRGEILKNLAQGKSPDSMLEVEPVSTREIHRNGNLETVDVYPDGSTSVTLIQERSGEFDPSAIGPLAAAEAQHAIAASSANPNAAFSTSADGAEITPMSIGGCTTHSGSGYATRYGCSIYGGNGLVNLGFKASYSIVNGAYDRIFDQYGPYQACTGAVCDVPYLVKWKQYEDSAGRAEVTYYMRYTASASSQTARLSLYVGGNSASTSFTARF